MYVSNENMVATSVSKLGQIGPNGTPQVIFQYILADMKNPGFVPCRANLSHFVPLSGILEHIVRVVNKAGKML